uniref:SHC-transforming protein 1-like n=1 Tax=Saccoglossus kowalevskii TaxID=10224 RepID=A0ABM0M1Y1_SACKO|nr:PREDICTED: SHC-transforming protein 1-like [Saccoglossus kowalevskii]
MAGMINRMRQKKAPESPNSRAADWSKNGTFINKPARGWLHPDDKLLHGGVCYGVRYVGCLEVKQSMRTLQFDVRGQVTKEAIHRVCESAGFKNVNKKRKVNKSVGKILGALPNIQFGGANVNLTISTNSINLMIMETGQIIANHQMQGISFASGGDPDCIDYVAYVAKDPVNGRACHVLQCAGGLAQDVITTVGQAFELRFKEYLRNPPKAVALPDRMEVPIFEEGVSAWGDEPQYYNDISKLPPIPKQSQPVPPPPGSHYQIPSSLPASNGVYSSIKDAPPGRSPRVDGEAIYDNRTEPNLIDFEAEAAIPTGEYTNDDSKNDDYVIDSDGKTQYANEGDKKIPRAIKEKEKVKAANTYVKSPELKVIKRSTRKAEKQKNVYEVCETKASAAYDRPNMAKASYDVPKPPVSAFDDSIYTLPQELHGSGRGETGDDAIRPMETTTSQDNIQQSAASSILTTDVFDMEPFKPPDGQAASGGSGEAEARAEARAEAGAALSPNPQTMDHEEWFHGPLSRKQAEVLLEEDGDFLVRESTTTAGQFVLSGVQGGHCKHLLLVDPKGVVRTKDKVFDSVNHLISYHRDNKVPIMSAGSAVRLSQPVLRH